MRGLITLFLAVVVLGISWRYLDYSSRYYVKQVVKDNFFVVAVAILTVAIAIVFSINTTVRLV